MLLIEFFSGVIIIRLGIVLTGMRFRLTSKRGDLPYQKSEWDRYWDE